MSKLIRPKIGLALGSGGSKGIAHIGVIKILEENNIPIDFIAGSSIGAMVGGFYVAGLNTKKMENIVTETDWRKMFSLVDINLKHGLIGGEKIKTFIDSYIGNKKIEDCKIPFIAVATDLKTGEIVTFNKGEMSQAIRASISVPLVLKPVEIEGKALADGGLSSSVPVEIVKKMGADIIIAVNLDKHFYDENSGLGPYDVANTSLNILRHHLALLNVKNADIVIDIDVGRNNSWYDFANGQDKIIIGEKATKEILPKLQELIHKKSKSKSGLRKYLNFFKV